MLNVRLFILETINLAFIIYKKQLINYNLVNTPARNTSKEKRSKGELKGKRGRGEFKGKRGVRIEGRESQRVRGELKENNGRGELKENRSKGELKAK